ncbi:MAG: cobalamin-dependent protein [Syntrophorhabdales bacterium]|jgi:5-methyltetrahydrofolate--homocysteine methyltransferase
MNNRLVAAISDLDEGEAVSLVKELLNEGVDPIAILASCQEGMMQVGKRFENAEYFISDLMMAAEIFKTATAPLETRISAGGGTRKKGTIVFGTVKGDIHNIGKDIVIGLLRAAGYDVLDLGTDVPAQRFVDAASETGARIVGLSGLLTIAYEAMKETRAALDAAGLDVKVMIGGGPMTASVKEYVGADGWGINAQSAVTLANQWTEAQDQGLYGSNESKGAGIGVDHG